MKITIEQKDGAIVTNVNAPEKTSRADIANVMSIALASTVTSVIPANAPKRLRMVIVEALADEIANAVKQDFLEIAAGRSGKNVAFTDKEADFLKKLMQQKGEMPE